MNDHPDIKDGIDMVGQIDQVVRFIVLLLICCCCSVLAEEPGNDALEGYNRAVFRFNDTADRYLLKPVAKGYRAVTPDPLEQGVSNAFDNLGEILNVANDLLQGKFGQAANDGGRFVINTTLGLAGFFDPADDMGLKKSEGEDFGQTLGRWGVESGPYFVIPFLGASTVRDAPSLIVDSFLNPVGEIDHVPTRNSVYGADFVDTRARLLDAEELISGDKYTFIREVYLQRRAYLVSDGEYTDSFGDDFDYSEDEDYQ